MVKVGDRVTSTLSYVFDEKTENTGRTRDGKGIFHGVVKWVHPKRRFYMAEFTLRDGKYSEGLFQGG